MHRFAVQVVVQPFDFGFLIDPEAHDRADDLENDKGSDGAIDDGGDDALQLGQNLTRPLIAHASKGELKVTQFL